eukprot:6457822-Amphidinium_carterae.1
MYSAWTWSLLLLPANRVFIVFAKSEALLKHTVQIVEECQSHVQHYAPPPMTDFLCSGDAEARAANQRR